MTRRILFSILLVFLTSYLTSCGYSPISTSPYTTSKPIIKRSPLASPTHYAQSAEAYLQMAQTNASPERENYLLKAIGRLIQTNDYDRAESLFQEINIQNLPEDLQHEAILLQASLSLHKQHPESALQLLSTITNIDRLTPPQKIYYYQLLAYAYYNTGDTVNSIQARLKLGALLTDIDEKIQNERHIWHALNRLDQATLHTLALETHDVIMKGWYQLAALQKQGANATDIRQWQTTYAQHPAQQFVSLNTERTEQATAIQSAATTPGAPVAIPTAPKFNNQSYNIALLLPLKGRYASASKSVQDGFFAAYQLSGSRNVAVQVYDVTQANALIPTYQRALQEGAHAVVGPMAKPSVQQLATGASLPVPTLALNYAPSARHTSNLYEFGLSPTLEATLAANKAIADGRRRVVIIRPNGAWGNEVANTFVQQWQQQGGVIVDQLTYSSKQDLNQSLKHFLRFSEYKVKAGRGRKKTVGNRRQDMDSIFLLATPSMGRQIRPLLKFYYAGEIPVYSTSMIYSGKASPQQDKDLDGIIFCDNPWVLRQGQTVPYDDVRLYALGMDAFGIITQLDAIRRSSHGEIATATGSVVLQDSRFQRALRWAQFRQGTPYLLD